MCGVDAIQRKIKSSQRKKQSNGGVSEQNPSECTYMYKEAKGTTEKNGGVDVLCIMFVTAAVFQFEISALNAEAPSNADEDNDKKTATGVCELTEFK